MEQTFPDVGEGLTEGVLAKWLVAVGETIRKDQMIARVSTDKSVVDIPSSVEGTITELIGEEGDTINVGDVILRTDAQGPAQNPHPPEHATEPEEPDPEEAAVPEPEPHAPTADESLSEPGEPIEELADASHVSPTRRMAAQVPQEERYETPARTDAHAHTRAPKSSSQDVHALPNVRHYAREHHIDLSTISGSGPDGRVTIDDLSSAAHTETNARTEHAVKTPHVRSDIIAPPSVRRYARERGIDIGTISGTGEHGRITRDDVERASAPPKRSAPTELIRSAPSEPTRSTPSEASRPKDAGVAGGREKLTPIRRIIAERMMSSHLHTAAVTHTDRADITKTVQIRQKWKTNAAEHGVNLTYLPFFIKAAVAALKAYPRFNASIEGDEIVMHDEYHIGIAVDTERGLVVPVIRHADRKSIIELAREIVELAGAARGATLRADQMHGSTFTITSVGNFGGEAFTPIINEPNSAILGIGAIKKMPHVYKGEIAVRDIVIYSLTYDHRIVDGADAARFVSRLVMLTEEPEHLFLEGI